MWQDWNFWFSLTTAIVAIIALFLTVVQIRTSNKQHLFDKRLENYIIISGLLELYKNNLHLFNRENEPIPEIALEFGWMTNNSYLEGVANVVDNPLKEPYHKNFLKKLEDLKNVSIQANFLYKGAIAELLSNFVYCYQELLFAMYQYSILFTRMQEASKQWGWSQEETFEKMKEAKQCIKLFVTITNLKQIYEDLQKTGIEKAIKKQIQLK